MDQDNLDISNIKKWFYENVKNVKIYSENEMMEANCTFDNITNEGEELEKSINNNMNHKDNIKYYDIKRKQNCNKYVKSYKLIKTCDIQDKSNSIKNIYDLNRDSNILLKVEDVERIKKNIALLMLNKETEILSMKKYVHYSDILGKEHCNGEAVQSLKDLKNNIKKFREILNNIQNSIKLFKRNHLGNNKSTANITTLIINEKELQEEIHKLLTGLSTNVERI
ncbi:hypothetical protein MKS88_005247 [Plasmodium brasilianum]|uniref:Uncharacterized protein n=1 Tax=Plasmodium brasilianum TaxID=5824 RepID=A0ACB9Y1N8_PLABR|nr:hypothetical protein MKS88_005247 [Plasmodium brasilianum]